MTRKTFRSSPEIIPGLWACVLVLLISVSARPAAAVDVPEKKPVQAVATTVQQEEMRSLRELIAKNPEDSIQHVRLGYLLLDSGAVDEAKASFAEALKLNRRSHAAMTGQGIVLARKGNLVEAEQVLKDALAQNPNPVRTHYELGLVYEKSGNLEKALAEYKEGIRKYQQGRK